MEFPHPFQFKFYVTDELVLFGIIVYGTLYWVAREIAEYIGYSDEYKKLKYYTKCLPQLRHLVPEDIKIKNVNGKSIMISHEHVLFLIHKMNDPEKLFSSYYKIFYGSLSCNFDIEFFLRKPSVTNKHPPVLYPDPKGIVFLYRIVKRLKNERRMKPNRKHYGQISNPIVDSDIETGFLPGPLHRPDSATCELASTHELSLSEIEHQSPQSNPFASVRSINSKEDPSCSFDFDSQLQTGWDHTLDYYGREFSDSETSIDFEFDFTEILEQSPAIEDISTRLIDL
ncbi:hypothetical protein AVEN_242291-1 [Araneus ventricosus]|uniref:Uncharacterized protein n=1 Tax=Araneus ventricosus TaxID=182803 RepID=A0A4Y2VZN1_ARAVE|nr:hypothetical protein AVEN_242291-1 [Araneus ventricosus]